MTQLIYDLLISTYGLQVGRVEVNFPTVLLTCLIMFVIFLMVQSYSIKQEMKGENDYLLGVAENRIKGLTDALDELQINFDDAITRINDLEAENRNLKSVNIEQSKVIGKYIDTKRKKEVVHGQ